MIVIRSHFLGLDFSCVRKCSNAAIAWSPLALPTALAPMGRGLLATVLGRLLLHGLDLGSLFGLVLVGATGRGERGGRRLALRLLRLLRPLDGLVHALLPLVGLAEVREGLLPVEEVDVNHRLVVLRPQG